ncbi:MAG: hypothetical protein KC483_02500 [Nitrosarchaeum sp.]|nr:hypothetical protein [Nitrosarchaeum sp.]
MDRGSLAVAPTFSAKVGFRNNIEYIFAQFFGTSSTPAEQTGSQSDYLTRLTFNDTLNAKWLTAAFSTSSTTTMEFPSLAVDSFTLNYSPEQYLTADFTSIANNRVIGSSTNTNAILNALTAPSENEIVVEQSDFFAINAQGGGALSGSDKLTSVESVTLTLSKPQQTKALIKGSAGNGQTRATDLYQGQLTVVLDTFADNTYLTAADAGTEYKAMLELEGDQIGTGDNQKFGIYLPRLKLIEEPDYSLTSPGDNPHTLVFDCLVAASNPTGMSSTMPYIEYVNTISSAYV